MKKNTLSNQPPLNAKEVNKANQIKDFAFTNIQHNYKPRYLQSHFKVTDHFLKNRLPLAFENKSLAELIKEYRMQKAVTMLQEKQSIKHISIALGFGNQNNFSRWFKENFGLPPTQYMQD